MAATLKQDLIDKISATEDENPLRLLKEDFKNVRSVLITKHNRLYYRIKETTIEVVNMYDRRMHSKKNLI